MATLGGPPQKAEAELAPYLPPRPSAAGTFPHSVGNILPPGPQPLAWGTSQIRQHVAAHSYPLVHMFVLGIDPGLTRTGYGVATRDGGRIKAIAAGVIRTTSTDTIERRLATLAAELRAVIAEHEPDSVALETVFTNRNRQTAMSVGRASGVALLVAGEAGVPVTEYTPTAIKLAVTGSGSADKAAMQQMVARRYGLVEAPRPADAADALGIALCHLQSINLKRSS